METEEEELYRFVAGMHAEGDEMNLSEAELDKFRVRWEYDGGEYSRSSSSEIGKR